MDEENYTRRLLAAIDQAARTSDGQMLLQHFFRMTGPFLTGSDNQSSLWIDGRRSVGVELLELIKSCRNGEAIVKTLLVQFVTEDMRDEGGDDEEREYLDAADVERS